MKCLRRTTCLTRGRRDASTGEGGCRPPPDRGRAVADVAGECPRRSPCSRTRTACRSQPSRGRRHRRPRLPRSLAQEAEADGQARGRGFFEWEDQRARSPRTRGRNRRARARAPRRRRRQPRHGDLYGRGPGAAALECRASGCVLRADFGGDVPRYSHHLERAREREVARRTGSSARSEGAARSTRRRRGSVSKVVDRRTRSRTHRTRRRRRAFEHTASFASRRIVGARRRP